MWNGTMFVDLDWPLNASSLLSASAELLVRIVKGFDSWFWSIFWNGQRRWACTEGPQVEVKSKGIRNIRSQDYSFPGTFVPMMELSFLGPFVPWNIRSLDRSFPGTFVLKTIRSLEHSFPGPLVPWNFCSRGPFVPKIYTKQITTKARWS